MDSNVYVNISNKIEETDSKSDYEKASKEPGIPEMETSVKLKLLHQEYKPNNYSENFCCETNLENEKDLYNTKIHREGNTNLFEDNGDLNVNKIHSSSIEDQIARLVGEVCYESEDSWKQQTENTRKNNKGSGNNQNYPIIETSSAAKEHIENFVEKQYVLDIRGEDEKTHENPVDHEEVEDSETEESPIPTVKNRNQLEDTYRLRIDSEEEGGFENLDGSSGGNSPNLNSHAKEEFVKSDNDFQYDTKHLLNVKEVKVLHECSICQYTTQNIGILRKHISTNHNLKTIWKCKHCCKRLGSKILLLKHVEKEHSKKSRKCPYCLLTLLCNGKVMKKHIKNMHPSEYLSTVRIAKDKPEFDGLTRNGSRGMYRCNRCSYSNRCLGVMLSHAKMHNIKHILKCLYCHYMINQRKLYKKHLASAHKLAKKIYICSMCFFQSEDQEIYAKHLYEPHVYHLCNSCNFKTYHIKTYYAHIEEHKKSKQHSKNSVNSLNHAEMLENDETRSEDKYLQNVSKVENYSDKGNNSTDEENNIESENLDYPNARNRKETTEHYTQREEDGITIFTCLKCDFNSKFRSIYEMCEHLENVHSIHLKKFEMETSKKCENVVEFIQVETEPEPINRYVIEPTATNLQAQTLNKNVSSFKCEQCDFSSPRLQEKVFHEQKRHDLRYFKCPNCSFRSNNEEILLDHFKSHIDSTKQIQICPFCEMEVDDQISLKKHVNVEHLDIPQEDVLHSSLKKVDESIKLGFVEDKPDEPSIETAFSIREGNFEKIYQCDLCSYNALDLFSLETHMKEDHIAKTLKCPRCFQKQSANVQEFWDHLNQHCPQCRFQSNNPEKLRLHVLTHVPRYKRCIDDESKSRLKRIVISDLVPVKTEEIDSVEFGKRTMNEKTNLEVMQRLEFDEFESETISDEEIRIIFEDSPHEDANSPELDKFEINEDKRIPMKNSREQLDSNAVYKKNSALTEGEFEESFDLHKEVSNDKQKKEIRLIIDRSNVESVNSKMPKVKTCTFESSKKLKGTPVRIIKISEFQCFDCLNIYKTRYTLVDHRKRLHGLKKPHSCTYCMEIFESYSYLKSHYYRIHKVSFHYKGPIFKCPLCEYNSTHLKQTQKHILKTHRRNVIGFQKRGDFC